jgi:prevent-host-death family protein
MPWKGRDSLYGSPSPYRLPIHCALGENVMLSVTTSQAKTHFEALLDRIQRGPVKITRRNHVVAVLISPDDYRAIRHFYAHRLRATLEQAASNAGLTEQQAAALIADDAH